MENQKQSTIKKIISPQLASEGGGVSWMSSLFPSEYFNFDPFISFEHFAKTESSSNSHNHSSRLISGMINFIYLLSGQMSFRINEQEIGKIKNGEALFLNSGEGVRFEQVFDLEQSNLEGFQIGINLPSIQKQAPPVFSVIEQQDIRIKHSENGVYIRNLYKSNFPGDDGQMLDIVDLAIPANTNYSHPVSQNKTVLAYLYQGRGFFGEFEENIDIFLHRSKLILYGQGDHIKISSEETPLRLLIVSGQRIGESISRYGSIVKHTQKEVNDYLKNTNNIAVNRD